MSDKKLLVVFGATGNQGGSVANITLADPELNKQYSVRGITRSASSPAAKALASKGAEIVEADTDKPETLPSALQGAHTVFLVTTTQTSGNTREIQTRQAKDVVNTAIKQGAQYIIWTSMSEPQKISGGKLTGVEHFDVFAEIERWIREQPIKSAFYAAGSFMQNFYGQQKPRPSPANDGSFVLANLCKPDTKVPLIDITETGKYVAAILAEPDKYEGKLFTAASGIYTYQEVAEAISKATGKKVVHKQVPDEVFGTFFGDSPMREPLVQMFQFIRDYRYFGPDEDKTVEWTAKQARGQLTSLDEFLKKNPLQLE